MAGMLLVQFEKGDRELREAIESAFADQAEFIEVKSFDAGVAECVQALIPAIPAAVQILVSYFTRPGASRSPRRVVVSQDGEISIEGYNREDVEAIIERAQSR